MKDSGASDLHMTVGAPPLLRLRGELEKVRYHELTPELNERLLFEIMTSDQIAEFKVRKDIDFAYEIPGVARFRVNIFLQRKGIGAVFRLIPAKILTVEELGLPAQILEFTKLKKGLIVVTGPTGSGKSTTLSAMIEHINSTRKDHIITIEDPIEFLHESKLCLVNQREIKSHAQSFASALRAALREDPDIILVGEMRDLETIELAITAAETGHLVLGTLHTISAAKTVDRIIDSFPADRQEQIRVMLSESLRGVIAQQLLRTADGRGRVAALEIMVMTPAIAHLIRERKTYQIPSLIQAGRSFGMQSMDSALMDLFQEGKITAEDALASASNPSLFEPYLKK